MNQIALTFPDKTAGKNFKHGHSYSNNGKPTPEYTAWQNMIRRCYDTKGKDYPYYGGRGILVCDRWRCNFSNFLEDMGLKPSPKHSIDRRRNGKNYEPGNCSWATKRQQSINMRSNKYGIYNGKRMLISSFAKLFDVSQSNITYYLKGGWTLSQIAFHYKNTVRKSPNHKV